MSVLTLVYSTAAGYCASAWARAFTEKVITQFHYTKKIISGTIKSIQTQWLPVLAYIAPTDVRRQTSTTFVT